MVSGGHPSGGRRHFPAWTPASLPAVRWQVSSLREPGVGVSSSASHLAPSSSSPESGAGGQSFPPGAGQHPILPSGLSANKCLYHSQWIRSRQQVWLLHHWVSVAILVGHVTMAGCKLRAQNHAPATEMYARRPSTDGSDDCAGSARPSFHTAPRRSGTP